MIALSRAQVSIVMAPIGNAILILASAGSGKTRVLTERIRHILLSTKRDGVIALTFTNKAAEEMQLRLSESEEATERAWVTTIHSVAQRVLEQYGHTIGLPSELHIYDVEKDRKEVFIQSLRDDGVDIDAYLNIQDSQERKNRDRILQKFMDSFSIIKRELLCEEDIASRFPNEPTLWKVYQDYQSALFNSGGIDYDDILLYAHRILLNHEWIANVYRAKYKHVCVDEAQDLNKIQYEFIKVLCGSTIKSVLMVGDPNQMIFGFNGSSSDFLCKSFVDDFEPLSFVLNENYRSTKAVIQVANKLKPDSQRGHDAALNGLLEIKSFANELSEAEWIANKISCLLNEKINVEIEGEISLDKMVVIAGNRFVFSKLEQVLAQAHIPYAMRRGERKSNPESKFGQILDYAIRVKLNPKDWVDGKKLCSLLQITPPISWENAAILEQWSNETSNKNVIPFAKLYSNLLIKISELDAESPNIRKFTEHFKGELRNLALVESNELMISELERSMEELEDFLKCWTRFKTKGLGESLQAFRNAISLGQLNEESISKGLTLSSVHTMKGLEKDIVFLMGMCEGVIPDYRATTSLKLEEERNKAFVAVTRAKRWLYITYPLNREMPWGGNKAQKESRFITAIKS